MATVHKYIKDLVAGDIVHAHGGRFEILEDAKESNGHRPQAGHMITAHGPSACAYCEGKWIGGAEVPGYFGSGIRSNWTFQGNILAGTVEVEVPEVEVLKLSGSLRDCSPKSVLLFNARS